MSQSKQDSAPVDVLAVLKSVEDRIRFECRCHGTNACAQCEWANDIEKSRAAMAELIEADRALDCSAARRIEASNRVVGGDRSDDAFREQASACHAYDRTVERRRAALARVRPMTREQQAAETGLRG